MTKVVYFVQSGSGAIKIGCTASLKLRVANLQVACSETLSVLATYPGGPDLEEHLHERFSDTRLSGEWFAASADLLNLVRLIASGATGLFPAGLEAGAEREAGRLVSTAVAEASAMLRRLAEPAPRNDSVRDAIARAAKIVGRWSTRPISISRIEDIWRHEARRIDADEFAAIAAADEARPRTLAELMLEGESLAEKLEGMIASRALRGLADAGRRHGAE